MHHQYPYPLGKKDMCLASTIVFTIDAYLLIRLNLNWEQFNTCQNPIQSFLLWFYIFNILIFGYCALEEIQVFRRNCNYVLTSTISMLLILNFCNALRGLLWHIGNSAETPDCLPGFVSEASLWTDIVICFLINITLAKIVSVKIQKYRAIIYMRQSMQRWNRSGNNNPLRENFLDSNESQILRNSVLRSELIRKLPQETYEFNSLDMFRFRQETCPICIEDFVRGKTVMYLPGCKHGYHARCIATWLEANEVCPLCRKEVGFDLIGKSLDIEMPTLSHRNHNIIN